MATDINFLKKTIMNRISSTIDTVQDVSSYEKSVFKGFPAVTVMCSGNENDYWSTAENQRQFTFIIRVYEQIEIVPNKGTLDTVSDNAKQRAEGIMGRVVSDIIDSFDQYYIFDNQADYCRAVPSVWGYAKVGEGWCRTAEIKLQVVQSFNVTT